MRQRKKSLKKLMKSTPRNAKVATEAYSSNMTLSTPSSENAPTVTSSNAKKSRKVTKKKKGTPNLKHFLTQKLRRISYQWPPRKEAIQKGRVSRGKYKCSSCLGENFGPQDIQLDHTIPVIDPHTGFTTWDNYIERLFCETAGFSVMCKECHKWKTSRENSVRSLIKNDKIEDDEI